MTKLELECELLKVENDIRHHANNARALNFRSVAFTPITENIEAAAYHQNRKADAENRADHIRNLLADFN